MLANVPTPQEVHALWPVAFVKVPGLQGVHAGCPGMPANVPTSQAAQELCPVTPAKLPGLQGVQAASLERTWSRIASRGNPFGSA